MSGITLKDVARQAGVSVQTVSQVMNDNLKWVGKATEERVRTIAREMGYVSNKAATTLRTGKTDVIGVTHSFLLQLEKGFASPYQSKLYAGIGSGLNGTRYNLLFQNVHGVTAADHQSELVFSRQIDGLVYIFYSMYQDVFEQQHLPNLKKADIPVVVIHTLDRSFPFTSVGFDCIEGGYRATCHLLEHGYASVGFVGVKANTLHHDLLYDGYVRALQEAGMPVKNEWRFTLRRGSLADGAAFARTLIASGEPLPRALFVGEEAVAHGVLAGLAESGVSVPDEVAVMGFGDYYRDDQISHRLSALVQPAFEKGRIAAEKLVEMLEGSGQKRAPETIILKPELHVRSSCGCGSGEQ